MLPIVRCSFFRVALVALLLVALLQLLYLSLLSSLHRQQQWFMYPMSGNRAQAESRWQKQQMEDLKAAIAGGGVLDSSGHINNLGHVRELVQHWDGRISLALFASGPLQAKLATMLAYSLFRLCPNVRNKVTFHLVCKYSSRATFQNWKMHLSCQSEHWRIKAGFINLAAKGLDPLTVFVVPAFEIRHTRRLPSTKKELLQLYQVGEVRSFYEELCPRCQAPTNYSHWINLPVRQAVPEVAYTVEWKDPWEPFYIGRSDVPAYDERFKQYGFNRIRRELNMAGFSFAVLDSAFLLHKGYKLPGDFHSQKDAENRRNRQLFRAFKEELKLRYPQSPRHC
ncbi:hypothetical protein GDO86_002793 [Hymenochirus boettgeri]|uniref:Beta-1,4-glucuronyltransferase 1 n=1 Tax=Hymenochirus boettgeri TaxID=247094 RepID=A0A8T2K0Y0_9PIPI|nr:hypothetical protein GDO86_002793 [Hymenochirus boettgeri]